VSDIWNRVFTSDPSFFGDAPSNFGLECYEDFKKQGKKKYWSWDVDRVETQFILPPRV
jgi:hypothetical protein